MNTSITAFGRMWTRCSAWPALQRATPTFIVVLLVAALLFGPNALTLSDLVNLIESSSSVLIGLLLLWSLAMAPALRASLEAPGLRYLRSLPGPRWFAPVHQMLLLLVLQIPLPALLVGAGKPALGVGLLGSGLGLGACLLLPSFSRLESLLTIGIGCAILFLLHRQLYPSAAGLGLLTALALVPRQLRYAASPTRRRPLGLPFGNRRRGLLVFQLLRLWRCEDATLFRTILLSGLGIATVDLVSRANQAEDFHRVALATLVATTPIFALTATILSLALQRGQQELRWLRISLGISTSQLRRSSMQLLVAVSLVIALLIAGVAMQGSDIRVSQLSALAGLQAVHAIFWAMLASQLSYLAAGRGRDQSPAMFALCIALANMLLLGLGGTWVLWIEGAMAILIASRILSAKVNQELGHA